MRYHQLRRYFGSTTLRLAGSYLLIIMALSVGFSVVFYQTSVHELSRQVPPQSFFDNRRVSQSRLGRNDPDYSHYFQDRIDEGRGALLAKLIILNLGALVLGSGLSYFLARKTLTPLEKAMESQSRFVTDASHELRTPLTAILTTNEVALRKPNLSLAQARELLLSNTEDAKKLKELSDDLLNLAQPDILSVSFGPIALQDITVEAINRLLPAAQAKKISIQDTVPDCMVTGNLQSLTQALVILLDNAIKYSSAKSTIIIEGSKQRKQSLLVVKDQGVGISAADLPHIFERFYRADVSRTTSSASGYGIGLSIAKKIIEQHHGTIVVSSVLGKGTSFGIEIPSASI